MINRKTTTLSLVLVGILMSLAYLLRHTDDSVQPVGTAPAPTEQEGEMRSIIPLRDASIYSDADSSRIVDTPPQMSDSPDVPLEPTQTQEPQSFSLSELCELLSLGALKHFRLDPADSDLSGLFTPEVLQEMLTTAGRTEKNLIAAHILSGEHAYLDEALSTGSDGVLAHILAISQHIMTETPPEGMGERIAHLRKSDPDNAILDYWETYRAFKQDDIETALTRFAEASKKPYLDSHSAGAKYALEQFLIDSGISEVPAKLIAFTKTGSVSLDQHRIMFALSSQIGKAYRMFDDPNRQEESIAFAQHTAVLGERLANSQSLDTIIADVVGIAIERRGLDREAALQKQIGNENRIAEISRRLSELDKEKQRIMLMAESPLSLDQILGACSETQVAEYFDRISTQGEYAAWLWAVENVIGAR